MDGAMTLTRPRRGKKPDSIPAVPPPGEPAGPTGPPADPDETVTTVKVRKRLQKKIAQLCALLDLNQQDVLDRYEAWITEDLMAELRRRGEEIRGERRG